MKIFPPVMTTTFELVFQTGETYQPRMKSDPVHLRYDRLIHIGKITLTTSIVSKDKMNLRDSRQLV